MFTGIKNYIVLTVIACLLLIAGYFIFLQINDKELPSNLIAGTGRIDGDLILLNTKYPARVEKIHVQDGDSVIENQIVAKLMSKELESKKEALQEAVKGTQNEKLSFSQNLKASRMQLQLLENTLPNLVKIKEENLKILEQNLKSITLKIEQLYLKYKQDKKDYQRYQKLFDSKAVTPKQFESKELTYKRTQKEYNALKIEKNKTINSIEIAKTALVIEKDNLIKIDIAKQNILSNETKLSALENKINQLTANKAEIDAMIEELQIKSPINGVVIDRLAQPGVVLGGGSGVALLINPDELYLKMFVDTIENGKIKIGDKAVIFLDAYPDAPIEAKIIRVEQRAEFTPKEVQIKSDRIQLMYAVHLIPITPQPNLKLGLPAIGVISIDGRGLPQSSKSLGDL